MSDEITTVHENVDGRQTTEKRVPHDGEVYVFATVDLGEYELQSHDAAPSAVLDELLDHLGEGQTVNAEELTAEASIEASGDQGDE
jgi:hypothetical protein